MPDPKRPSETLQDVSQTDTGASLNSLRLTMTSKSDLWDEYKLEKPLGSGSFGVVRSVTCRTSKKSYAAKTVRLNEDDPECLMVSLEHPHILRLHRILEDRGEMHFILDLCSGGDLQTWIEESYEEDFEGLRVYGQPGTSKVAEMGRQMLSAVAYLHERSIAHRDVKPQNWMVACHGFYPQLKLSDFGLACRHQDGEVMTEKCGSTMYMAPEVFQRSYTALCDVWGTGLTLNDLVCGTPLFAKIPEAALEAAVSAPIKLPQIHWKYQKPWLQDLVMQLLVPEKSRLPAAEALERIDGHSAKCGCHVS
mmetsp:Transcript_9566/g.17762  ORF Transcript_9566/g.17762 Transcript_9566/m.17762 type:complete len:307 (+) Transcript_9566:47-967(+)